MSHLIAPQVVLSLHIWWMSCIICIPIVRTPPPPFINCGWNIMGRDGKFLLEMERKPGMGADGKFLKSLYIVARGVLTPLYIAYPPFSIFVHPPPPLEPNPHLHCSFCCHVSLAEWVITPLLTCYFT